MFIYKDTKKRCNPFSSYTDSKGTLYPRVPTELYEEMADPPTPDDYTEETYYRNEIDDAPYVIYTKKSQDQLLSLRWNKIKIIRDELTENGGCFVAGKWFHSDTKSKQQQMALLMLGQSLPSGIQWKTMDGSFVELTPELVSQIFAAQVQRDQSIFLIAESKKVDDSPLNEGWPERYMSVGVV